MKLEQALHNEKSHSNPTHLGPYWKRMHRDPRFWIGFVFILLALSIYIMSVDLSIQPPTPQQQE